jgi:hypothetical protein
MRFDKTHSIWSWLLRGTAAAILLQTLFFKFTGAPESVYIFTTLGIEPWGRIGSGLVELVSSILLLVPGTVVYGALLALGTMGVAILSHMTRLGLTLPLVDDHGELFTLAVIVFACAAGVLALHWREIPIPARRKLMRRHEV